MKKLFASTLLSFSFLIAMAQPPAGPVKKGDHYGAKVKAKKAMTVGELKTALNSQDEVNTKVIGKVVDVCDKKGCWLTLQTPDNSKVFVKMKDYGFFVPTELKGHTVVMAGNAKMKETSVEELKHFAEDAKKSKEEIAAITKPEKEIRFMASGITVVD